MKKQKRKLLVFFALSLAMLVSFSSSALATGTATVSWVAPADSDLDGYRVYYSTTSQWATTCPTDAGSYVTVSDESLENRTFTNLTVGSTYYFTVMAFDTTGNLSACAITDDGPAETEVSKAILYHNGDLNTDTAINSNDFTLFSEHYGQSVCGPTEPADINRDCSVNANDFTLLATNYGLDY